MLLSVVGILTAVVVLRVSISESGLNDSDDLPNGLYNANLSLGDPDPASSSDSYLLKRSSLLVCVPLTRQIELFSEQRLLGVRPVCFLFSSFFSGDTRTRNRAVELRDKREQLRQYHAGSRIPRLDSDESDSWINPRSIA